MVPAADDGPRTAGPRATVVIATCDRPDVVDRAVASALAQTEPDVEVVVVDDGTTAPFALRTDDPRVRVLRTSGRQGANRARNLGLRAARGEWVAFLDDDDELLPGMVERSLAAGRASTLPPPVSVISGIEEVDPRGHTRVRLPTTSRRRGLRYHLETDVDDETRYGLASYNTLLAPAALLRDIGGFDESIRAFMHTDLLLRLNRASSIQAVGEPTYRMYHHDEQRLSMSLLPKADGISRTLEKHRDVFAANRPQEAAYRTAAGQRYLRAGRWGPAARHLTLAFLRDPRRPRALRRMLVAWSGPAARRTLDAVLERRWSPVPARPPATAPGAHPFRPPPSTGEATVVPAAPGGAGGHGDDGAGSGDGVSDRAGDRA